MYIHEIVAVQLSFSVKEKQSLYFKSNIQLILGIRQSKNDIARIAPFLQFIVYIKPSDLRVGKARFTTQIYSWVASAHIGILHHTNFVIAMWSCHEVYPIWREWPKDSR